MRVMKPSQSWRGKVYKLDEEMKEKYHMFDPNEFQKTISDFSDKMNGQFEDLIREYVASNKIVFNPIEYGLKEYPHENRRELWHKGNLVFWTQIVYGDDKATFNIHRCF